MASDAQIRQFTEAAMRRIANAVRDVEQMRREIRGHRRVGGFTYPNFSRPAVAYGAIPAGTTTEAGVGECKFFRINTDGSFETPEDTPTTIYNLGSAITDGNVLIADLDIQGKTTDGTRAIWITGYDSATGWLEKPCEVYNFVTTSFAAGAAQTVYWGDARNWDTTAYRVATDGIAANGAEYIELRLGGLYRVGFQVDWLPSATSGEVGDTWTSDDLAFLLATAQLTVDDGGGEVSLPNAAIQIGVVHNEETGGYSSGTASVQTWYRNEDITKMRLKIDNAEDFPSSTLGGSMWAVWLDYDAAPNTEIND